MSLLRWGSRTRAGGWPFPHSMHRFLHLFTARAWPGQGGGTAWPGKKHFPNHLATAHPSSDLPWYRKVRGLRKHDKGRISGVRRRIK